MADTFGQGAYMNQHLGEIEGYKMMWGILGGSLVYVRGINQFNIGVVCGMSNIPKRNIEMVKFACWSEIREGIYSELGG